MGRMGNRSAFVIVLTLASLVAVSTAAMHMAFEPAPCLEDHHRAIFDRRVDIPDDNPDGIRLGPLCTDISGLLEEVVLAISLTHPSTGHVAMVLEYDADRDGQAEASAPVEIYLARRRLCQGTESWACPIELTGTYYFIDQGWRDAGETVSFDVFKGLEACGDWYLSVVDSAPGGRGRVTGWAIFTATTARDMEMADRRIAGCKHAPEDELLHLH